MKLFNRHILLDPEVTTEGGSTGGPITDALKSAQAGVPTVAEQTPAAPDKDLTKTMEHADWESEEGMKTSIDEFTDTAVYQKPDPKVEVKEEEPSKEIDKEVIVQETAQTQTQQIQADPLSERFPEASALSKKMDKNAKENYYARLREILKLEQEKTELSESLTLASKGRTKVPESYYENPHAYVLLPEYHKAVAHTNIAAELKQHWLKQKSAVINGRDYTRAEVKQDADGNLSVAYSQPIKWSEGAIEEVEDSFDHCASQLRNMQRNQQSIEQGFRANVEQRIGRIRGAESELFPAEVWDNKETAQFKMLENVKEGIKQLGITPANPAYGLLVKTGAALLLEREYTAVLRKQTEKKQAVASDVRRAGPTGNFTVGGGGAKSKPAAGGDDTDFSIDEFTKLMPQY